MGISSAIANLPDKLAPVQETGERERIEALRDAERNAVTLFDEAISRGLVGPARARAS